MSGFTFSDRLCDLLAMSDGEQVKHFMGLVEQPTPEKLTQLTSEQLDLRENLISEEYAELMEEVKLYRENLGYTGVISSRQVAHMVKEAADVLVVVHGLFVDLGLNAAVIHALVMLNNNDKVAHKIILPSGKVSTPPEKKAELKEKIEAELLAYVNSMLG